jgi:hypothetical protein
MVVVSWALSAQTPALNQADVERRLSAMERMVRKGPGNSTQVTAPFDVVGADGKTMLRVGKDLGTPKAQVYIGPGHIPGASGGAVYVLSDAGTGGVAMGTSDKGFGVVFATDASGNNRAQLDGNGTVVVHDENEVPVAGVGIRDGYGSIAIWHKESKVLSLDADPQTGNAGALTLMNPAGNVVAVMKATTGGNAGTLSVMNSAGKPVAGLTAGGASGGAVVVANAGGVGLAQMSITSDGRGLVQVFGKNQNPLAVLTQATDAPGGLLQIYNASLAVANVTVAQGGGGMLQLSSNGGVPTVEAGTLPSGRGIVRVGPQYVCNPVKPATPVIGIPGFEDCLVGKAGK